MVQEYLVNLSVQGKYLNMETNSKSRFKTADEYILSLPEEVQVLMEELRKTIKQAAPEAQEVISYNMPAFRFHGILVYYAAHREHIGFYPADATFSEVFKKDIAGFFTSKGTIRFPFGQPIPHDLVKKIVLYRVKRNLEKAALRGIKKQAGGGYK